MKRWVQGLNIILASIAGSVAALAFALAWGPHHCKIAFPMVIGCAMGSYENLAGGLFAASAALFAGWLAWSAVQVQISAEETRAAADRVEIENVLQRDLGDMADGLAAIWRILADLEQSPPPADTLTDRLGGVVYGIDRITKDVPTLRQMVTVLGWERRRIYEAWLDNLERLGSFRNVDSFDISSALDMTMDVTSYVEMLRPETIPYFEGLWRREPKAWTLGFAIEMEAGIANKYAGADADAAEK